jgi:nucleoside phosphorylase
VKVLIVDDLDSKAHELKLWILNFEQGADVVRVENAHAGFRALTQDKFDLVLLDLVVPLTAGAIPSEEASVWFVKEVQRKVSDQLFPLIVGTTMYADSLGRLALVFGHHLWSIIYVNENDSRWRQQLSYAVRFARSKSADVRTARSSGEKCDVAVVTALRYPEFTEAVDAFGGGDQLVVQETSESWLRCNIEHSGGKRFSVVLACADEMGMCAMSALVTRLCLMCAPTYLVLSGIMGGNAARVGISDLVLIEETWDCRAGKLTENGLQPDTKSQRCTFRLANAARAVLDEDALIDIWRNSKGVKPQQFPRLHVGAVACSPAVIAHDEAFSDLEQQKRKVLGVEMEAFGCYDAVHRLGNLAPEVLCLKSVCDLGDKSKADEYQRFCAYVAARATVRLLQDPRFPKAI